MRARIVFGDSRDRFFARKGCSMQLSLPLRGSVSVLPGKVEPYSQQGLHTLSAVPASTMHDSQV